MYGKIFESLYKGSMVGAGLEVYAVWPYVIANFKPDQEMGAQVELNPDLLAFILGTTREKVEKAIEYLCKPDPKSTSKAEGGRRLVRVGQFSYRVVNGSNYQKIRTAEERREYQRQKQSEYRQRKRAGSNNRPKPQNGDLGEESVAEREAREVEEREAKLERGREMAEEAKAALLRTERGGEVEF